MGTAAARTGERDLCVRTTRYAIRPSVALVGARSGRRQTTLRRLEWWQLVVCQRARGRARRRSVGQRAPAGSVRRIPRLSIRPLAWDLPPERLEDSAWPLLPIAVGRAAERAGVHVIRDRVHARGAATVAGR